MGNCGKQQIKKNNPSVTASRVNLLANFLPFTQGRLEEKHEKSPILHQQRRKIGLGIRF